ncbi:MAG: 30S ribosomal protein S6 [Ruminococcaceae bacterium]|nr:30S ribosomal protein S6 [Oscillospiraceae bacterium]
MNKYESMFVFSVAKGEEAVAALSEKFQALITKAGGTLVSAEPFGGINGVRNLAYEINDETQGAYVLMNYEANASLPAELERVAGITEGVLRVLTIRK